MDGILRGTRELKLAEGRSIALILRKEYPKMFAPTSGTLKYYIINFVIPTSHPQFEGTVIVYIIQLITQGRLKRLKN